MLNVAELNKSDIKRLTGKQTETCRQIFEKAKELDDDPYNWRPTKVPLHLVIEVLNWDLEVTLRLLEKNLLSYKKSPTGE